MIKQFNPYQNTTSSIRFNATYDKAQSNEANLYDNIASEYLWLHGDDVVFIPREVGVTEEVFGEFLASKFDKGYPFRMFVEEMEAWGGSGDMFSKFGLQVTDECTVWITKTAFSQGASDVYPKQGDILYINKSQKLFEVQGVEDEVKPGFYHFGNKTWYKISSKLFSYNHEIINQSVSAGIPDAIQALDNLLAAVDNSSVSLEAKETMTYNTKIEDIADEFVDDSEVDPLQG